MNDDLYVIRKYEPLWGSWKVESYIGKGNYGKVYKIVREDLSGRYESALKCITIPRSEEEIQVVKNMTLSSEAQYAYFQNLIQSILNEIKILYKLKGNKNVINYEDHLIFENRNSLQWDILIRMEYLQPLSSFTNLSEISEEQVLQIGLDICNALIGCEEYDIIHRDIKDSNIFVDKNGNFKLGDFGISRELSKTELAHSMIGTPLYCAPEILKGENYDKTVDVYSLGLLMYKLANKGRLPFMPDSNKEVVYSDSEESLKKRLYGQKPSLPSNCSKELGNIILKAIEYYPKDRYSPNDMREALLAVRNKSQVKGKIDDNETTEFEKTIPLNSYKDLYKNKEKDTNNKDDKEPKKYRFKLIILTILLFTMIVAAILFVIKSPDHVQKLLSKIVSLDFGKSDEISSSSSENDEMLENDDSNYNNFLKVNENMDITKIKKLFKKNFSIVDEDNSVPNIKSYVFKNPDSSNTMIIAFDSNNAMVDKKINLKKEDFPSNINSVPEANIVLDDSRGIEGVVSKYGSRGLLIEKTYKAIGTFYIGETYAWPLRYSNGYLAVDLDSNNRIKTYKVLTFN